MLLFNRYEYNPNTDLTGKGGFSRVYKAFDKKLQTPVALKLYKTNPVFGNNIATSSIKELMQLEHTDIVRYIEVEELEREDAFGETEKIQVCVTEYAEGGNIKTFFESNRDYSLLKQCIADAIEGIAYLHSKNIIHGHIKPENILVYKSASHFVAKVSDFGYNSSNTGENNSLPSLTVSISYLAPEQLNPEKYGIDDKISFNIDTWLLGLTVYETICGEPLFRNNNRESSEQVMRNILEEELPEKINNLPAPFLNFVKTCLIKDAKKRPQEITELMQLLKPEEKQIPVDDTTVILQTPDIQPQSETPSADNTTIISDETQIIINPVSETKVIIKEEQPTTIPVDNETVFLSDHSISDNTQVMDIVAEAGDETDATKIISVDETKIMKADETQILNKKNTDDTVVLPAEMREGSVLLFNRYEYLPVADLIGRGGFSRVYKAYDKKLNRWVALKIYKTNDLSDRYSPFAEIRRVINLDHPNICRYLDIEEMESINPFGETEKIQVCVMELLDGGNIAEYYRTHADPALLKKLVLDILNGLSYLHKKGIIHRDIKPANILIKQTSEGPVAKITDFGISKATDSINNNSSSALIVSIPFMAPEQFNARKYGIDEKISFNLDLWSLGVTVYEIFTGKVLFKDNEQDNSEQIMANIMAIELPSKINILPEPFKKLVSSCLIKSARERVQKADELITLLEEKKKSPVLYVVEKEPEQEKEIKKEIIEDIPSGKFSFSEKIHSSNGNGHHPATETKTEHVTRRSFIIDTPEEETKKPATKFGKDKKIIIAAAGILLLLIYFLFIRKYMNQNSITASEKNVIPAVNTPVKNISAADSAANTAATDTLVSIETTAPENKITTEKNDPATNSKSTTPSHKREKPKLQTVVSRDKVFLLEFTASETCKITLNDQVYPELAKGAILKTYMQPGTYFLKAVSSSGKQYSKAINVLQRDIGRVSNINIEFHP